MLKGRYIMILDEIAEKTRRRVEEAKFRVPLEELKRDAESMDCSTGFPFEMALRSGDIAFICEVKKASPSKGLIARDFQYLQIAKEYEIAGAAAISVLTEPFYFRGKDEYLEDISSTVRIPVLRKDFTVDEYMIYEAKLLGASAVLLICALLDTETIRSYLKIANSLGLSAIVEAHTEAEVKSARQAGARIIGVNNRNLRDFTVDMSTSLRLRNLAGGDVIFVSESGIKTAQDIEMLRQAGADAVLVGETLMRSVDKRAALAELRGKQL